MTVTTPVATDFQPTTNLGRTAAEHKAMLDHLITIGAAMNTTPTVWGRTEASATSKGLEAVVGIGATHAKTLKSAGIETLEQLATIDERTKTRLDEVAGFPYASFTDWIAQAKDLTRESRKLDPGAVEYRAGVVECAGLPIDDDGSVEKVMKDDVEGEPAIVVRFGLYDAPEHEASRRLESALKAVAEACDGKPRVPDLVASDVEELRRVRDALDRGETIDDKLDGLNSVLRDARLELRHEPDPSAGPGEYQSAAEARRTGPAGARYDNRGLAVVTGYDNENIVGGGGYGNAGLAVVSGYDNLNPVGGGQYGNRGLAVASGYDNINPLGPEFAIRSGTGGVRAEGRGYQPPQRHEPGSADSVELAGPGRAVDGSAADALPEAEAEQEAEAEPEEER